MTNELEPCPFCGRQPQTVTKHDVGHTCSVINYTFVVTRKAWNTRYKRTCKLIMLEGSPACSECLTKQDYNAKFCDQCGSEVVDGN